MDEQNVPVRPDATPVIQPQTSGTIQNTYRPGPQQVVSSTSNSPAQNTVISDTIPSPYESLEGNDSDEGLGATTVTATVASNSTDTVLAQQAPAPKKSGLGVRDRELNKVLMRVVVGGVAVMLLLLGGISLANRFSSNRPVDPIAGVEEQELSSLSSKAETLGIETSNSTLLVNGNILAVGDLQVSDGIVTSSIVLTEGARSQTYTLPDSSGVFCLDSNNCGYLQAGDVPNTTIAGNDGDFTIGTGLALNGSTISSTITQTVQTSVNNSVGAITLQGTTNRVSITKNGNTFTLSGPQDLGLTDTPTFGSIALTNVGTQNGNVLCDISNNCGYAGGANAFIQNGNSFGAEAVLGTNDSYNLSFETDGVIRATIDTSGNLGITGQFVSGNSGTASNPGFTFLSDQDTGLYRTNANEVAISTGGVNNTTFSSGGVDIAGHLAVGDNAAVSTPAALLIDETYTSADTLSCVFGCYGAQIIVRTESGGPGNGVANLALQTLVGDGVTQNVATGVFINTASLGTGATLQNAYGIRIANQTGSIGGYGIEISGATTQALWVGSGGTYTTANQGIAFGSGRDVNLYRSAADTLRTDDALSVGGTLTVATLGTTDTATYLCRNASNQLAACNTTGTGAAFLQGGNSFGATATLGTNDSNSIVFETNNTTQATIAVGGATTFQNSTNSTNALRVLNAAGTTTVLNVDTTNGRVGIGNNAPTVALDVTGDSIISDRLQVGPTGNTIGQCASIFGPLTCDAALDVANTSTETSNASYGVNSSLSIAPGGANSASNVGMYSQLTLNGTNNYSGTNSGIYGLASSANTSGTISRLVGVQGNAGMFTSASTAIVNQAMGLYGAVGVISSTSGGTVEDGYGLYIDSASASDTGASITENYGIYVAPQTNAATNGSANYGIAIGAADTQTLWLSQNTDSTTAAGGIAFGSSRDTNLYRSAANTLRTDDALSVGDDITVTGDILPSADDTYDLGSNSNRWRDLYLGPATLSIGTSATDYKISYDTGNNALLFNNGQDDRDFRIAGDTQANLLYVDAGNNRVGIGTNTPGYELDVVGTINASSAINVNGTQVCTSSGCLAAAGSGNYIQNGTSIQTNTNFAIQSAAAGSVGAVIRGASSQTANLQEWQNSTGTVLSNIDASGNLRIGTNYASGGAIRLANNSSITARNSANTGDKTLIGIDTSDIITVGGGSASGSIYLMNTTGSGIAVATAVSAAGPGRGIVQGSSNIGLYHYNGTISLTPGQSAAYATVLTAAQVGTNVTIQSAHTSDIALAVKGYSGQTANLQEWQNSSGTRLTSIESTGSLYSPTAPIKLGYNVALQGEHSGGGGFVDLIKRSSGNSVSVGNGTTDTSVNAVTYLDLVVGGANGVRLGSYNVNKYGAIGYLGSSSAFWNALWLQPVNATSVAGTIRAQASQSANLMEWQSSAGTVLTAVDASGNLLFDSGKGISTTAADGNLYIGQSSRAGGTGGKNLYYGSAYYGGYAHEFFGGSASNMTGVMLVTSSQASKIGLTVKGAASQTGNLQEWQDSSGTVLAYLSASGNLAINHTGNNYLTINSTNSGSANLQLGTAGTGPLLLYDPVDTSLQFQMSGATRMQLTQAGVLKLNNTGLDDRLEFVNSGISAANIIWGSGSTTGYRLGKDASGYFRLANSSLVSTRNLSFNGADGLFGINTQYPTTAALEINVPSAANLGLIVRGASSQSANLQSWRNSSDTQLVTISATGELTLTQATNFGNVSRLRTGGSGFLDWDTTAQTVKLGDHSSTWNSIYIGHGGSASRAGNVLVGANTGTPGARLHVKGSDLYPSTKGLIVQGAVSQSANLQEWQNSAGTILAAVDASGRSSFGSSSTSWGMQAAASGTAVTGYTYGGVGVMGWSLTSASVALVAQGCGGCVGDLQQWRNSTGTSLSSVNASGAFFIGGASTSYGSAMLQVRNNAYGDIASFQGNNGTVKIIGGSKIELGSTVAYVDYGELALTNNSGNIVIRNSYNGPNSGVTIRANGTGVGTNADVVFQTQSGSVETMRIKGSGNVGIGEVSPSAKLQVTNTDAATVATIIKGASAQTANLQEWQNSAGTVLTSISSAGYLNSPRFKEDSNGVVIGGASTPTAGVNVRIESTGGSNRALVVKGYSGQTANLQEWQDSAGTSLAVITSSGVLQFGASNDATLYRSSSGNITTNSRLNVTGGGAGDYALVVAGTGDPLRLNLGYGSNHGSVTGNANIIMVADQDANLSSGNNYFSWGFDGTTSTYTEKMRLNDYGQLGIGTNSFGSQSMLTVNANSTADSSANVQFNANAATRKVLVLQGFASQTANLQEWQDSTGTVLGRVAADGSIYAPGLVSTGTSAASGFVRMSNAENLAWRNSSNTSDYTLGLNSSNQLVSTAPIWVSSDGTILYGRGGIGQARTALVYNGANEYLGLWSNNSEKMRLTASNGVQFGAYSFTGGTNEKLRVNTPVTVDNLANTILTASATTAKPLVVQGLASQSANLQEWQDSTGTALAAVTASGTIQASTYFTFTNDTDTSLYRNGADQIRINTGGTDRLQLDSNSLLMNGRLAVSNSISAGGPTFGTAEKFRVNAPNTIDNSANAIITTSASTSKGLVIQGSSGQTANLLEVQDSAGGIMVAIGTASGGIVNSAVNRAGFTQFGYSNWAGSGTVRMSNTAAINWRNAANTGDITGVNVTSSNVLQLAAAVTTNDANTSTSIGTTGTTRKGLVIQGVASQAANLQEWQDSTGAVLASIAADGDLEVVDATVNGNLVVDGTATFGGNITVNGKIITGNASGSTTVTVDTAGAGTGASASISGNDTSGVITINTGTGAAAGRLATITFSSAFPSAPNVVITPKAIPGGGTYPQYHFDSATGTFDLSSFNALTDSSTYTFSYFIVD